LEQAGREEPAVKMSALTKPAPALWPTATFRIAVAAIAIAASASLAHAQCADLVLCDGRSLRDQGQAREFCHQSVFLSA
jgi:hypothetical protein